LLLSLLVLAGLAIFYGGLAEFPRRYLYSEPTAEQAETAAPTSGSTAPAVARTWPPQDPLAVCAECHTPADAERFRKVIAPLLAAVASGYGAGAPPRPELSFAPPPVPGAAGPTDRAANATLAESR
jgi:hypothetical protein